ncbi:MAG: hypothetical protein K0Q79_3443 [Flavipsychrobacter sp.]|jgi:hypothetical protein|nr:hypothetical protein [Flavipsychrobacter sp.]
MKRIILISVLFTAALSGYAQNRSNALFRTDNQTGAPKEVYSLGANPEFPFLRNLSTSEQVASAIRRNSARPQGAELNNMLQDIGFANGGKDVTASNVTKETLPPGTSGNMGDGNHNTHHVKLMADGDGGSGIPAWKITSPTGSSMHILAKCGNGFSASKPATAQTTPCFNVPVTLTGTTKEITVGGNGATKTTTEATYVYYKMKNRDRALAPEFADLRDPNASTPLLLSSSKTVESVAQTYRVSLATPSDQHNMVVCEDKSLDLTADINVEKVGAYSGFYPSASKNKYKEVSKCVYKKVARKMRKAERKEEKVAKLTGVKVKTETVAMK